jgi:hypothetical protein
MDQGDGQTWGWLLLRETHGSSTRCAFTFKEQVRAVPGPSMVPPKDQPRLFLFQHGSPRPLTQERAPATVTTIFAVTTVAPAEV